eukprot:COSAG03_NODE_6947_length_984_cov_0.789831_1_plen_202_part_10
MSFSFPTHVTLGARDVGLQCIVKCRDTCTVYYTLQVLYLSTTSRAGAPMGEKGGCRHCAQQPSPCCSQAAAPPENCPFTQLEDGILEVGASACPIPQGAWGSTFLLLSAIAAALYVGGGAGFSKHTTGRVAHPHAEIWRECAGLVLDGVRFAAAVLGSGGVPSSMGGAEYSTLGDVDGLPPDGAQPVTETSAAEGNASTGQE